MWWMIGGGEPSERVSGHVRGLEELEDWARGVGKVSLGIRIVAPGGRLTSRPGSGLHPDRGDFSIGGQNGPMFEWAARAVPAFEICKRSRE
jgi:hypothetical protein